MLQTNKSFQECSGMKELRLFHHRRGASGHCIAQRCQCCAARNKKAASLPLSLSHKQTNPPICAQSRLVNTTFIITLLATRITFTLFFNHFEEKGFCHNMKTQTFIVNCIILWFSLMYYKFKTLPNDIFTQKGSLKSPFQVLHDIVILYSNCNSLRVTLIIAQRIRIVKVKIISRTDSFRTQIEDLMTKSICVGICEL